MATARGFQEPCRLPTPERVHPRTTRPTALRPQYRAGAQATPRRHQRPAAQRTRAVGSQRRVVVQRQNSPFPLPRPGKTLLLRWANRLSLPMAQARGLPEVLLTVGPGPLLVTLGPPNIAVRCQPPTPNAYLIICTFSSGLPPAEGYRSVPLSISGRRYPSLLRYTTVVMLSSAWYWRLK